MNPTTVTEIKTAPSTREAPRSTEVLSPGAILQQEQLRMEELASGVSGGFANLAERAPKTDLSQEKESLVGLREELDELGEATQERIEDVIGVPHAEQPVFGEDELQSCLGRLKVYKSADEALEPWLKDDEVDFLDIPRTEKTAQTIIAFKNERRKKREKTVLAYVVVNKESKKAVNLLDVLPPEENWQVVYKPNDYAPRVERDEKRIVINELPSLDFLGITAEAKPLIMVAAHEIGHAVKTEEERFLTLKLFKGLSLKELVPVMLLAFSRTLLAPLLRFSQGAQKFHELDAQQDRKATAIALRVIGKMRQLGIDPLPGMTDNEIIVPFQQSLEGKDRFSTGGKVYSH